MEYMIVIKNKRCKEEKLLAEFPGAIVIDVTSKGKGEWQRLSPFYPHGGIPVPGRVGVACSVEGVWQGLKVFENEGIDVTTFRNNTMRGIKRTVKTHGRILGHQLGDEIVDYLTARRQIYVPTYNWMLENKCQEQVRKIKALSAQRTVILLDYNTNENIDDPKTPLSHASLIKAYVEKG